MKFARLLRDFFEPELIYQTRRQVGAVEEEDCGSVISEPLCSPDYSYRFFMNVWDRELLLMQEQVYVLFLNKKNEVKSWRCLHSGGTSNCMLDNKLLLHFAIRELAEKVVIAHNHPDGQLCPSKADIAATLALNDLCRLADIKLADHLIITKGGYYSFSDAGYL